MVWSGLKQKPAHKDGHHTHQQGGGCNEDFDVDEQGWTLSGLPESSFRLARGEGLQSFGVVEAAIFRRFSDHPAVQIHLLNILCV